MKNPYKEEKYYLIMDDTDVEFETPMPEPPDDPEMRKRVFEKAGYVLYNGTYIPKEDLPKEKN